MGRNARGVKGMSLRDDDRVVTMDALTPQADWEVLTLCENGYGKRTAASDYRAQSRAGLGLITIKVNERNGDVAANSLVHAEDHVIVVTSSGKVIRTPVDGISVLGRNTQGVRIVRMSQAGERVVALARMVDSDDEDKELTVAEPAEDSEVEPEEPEPDSEPEQPEQPEQPDSE